MRSVRRLGENPRDDGRRHAFLLQYFPYRVCLAKELLRRLASNYSRAWLSSRPPLSQWVTKNSEKLRISRKGEQI